MGPGEDVRSLAARVVAEEDRRATTGVDSVEPGDELAGVGPPMSVATAIRTGGASTITILTLLLLIEEFDRAAIVVFGPEIQRSLGISDTTLIGMMSLGGLVLVVATLPMAALGDRVRRTSVLGACTIAWSVCVALTGRVVNPFQMALARMGSGLSSAANIPLSPSVIADRYPIQARVRMLALEGLGRTAGQVIGPLVAGALAVALGDEPGSWRTVLLIVAIPGAVLGVVTLFLPEPPKGQMEQKAILGELLGGADPPVRTSAVFQRLKAVRTYYAMVTGIGVLGFALVAVPGLMSLMLENEARYGFGPYRRGWLFSVSLAGQFVAVPIAAVVGERLFRSEPTRVLKAMGLFIVLYGVFMTVALRMQPVGLLVGFWTVANMCLGVAFVTMRPVISAIVPFRMRAQAFAMVGVYIFLMGGFFGGLLAGAVADATSERTALSIVVLPAAALGGLLVVRGARHLRADMAACVAELREEHEELRRMGTSADVPVLQVRHVDASYGPLQVLFDVGLEVRRGETLALLGTNGAGKSTLLRCIAGTLMPDRGVVRLNGRTITLVAPELRAGLGVLEIPGGEALFTSMSVRENLEIWARLIDDPVGRQAAIGRVLDTFPGLTVLLDRRAGQLSGGQQQMLALGKALMIEPEVLLIDELSLGLAPVVVQQLISVVEQLKARGMTIVIVEQSVNLALALADTAVFMERGQVRFQGPARDLLERDDLLRSVFLSGVRE